jgi:hypothetical protein
MKNSPVQTFENFHALKNAKKDPKISGLEKFKGRSLFGGYISDFFIHNSATVGVTITEQKDPASKVIAKIYYWTIDFFWQLDDLRGKDTPEDKKLLAEIGDTIDSDNK